VIRRCATSMRRVRVTSFPSSWHSLAMCVTLCSLHEADRALLFLLLYIILLQCTKKKKIHQTSHSSARSSLPCQMSSSAEMDATFYRVTILHSAFGTSTWILNLSKLSMYMIIFVLNFAIFMRMTASLINSNVLGLEMESK
jgi:hypothetical protein